MDQCILYIPSLLFILHPIIPFILYPLLAALCDYIIYNDHNMKKALELCALATQVW